MHQNLQLAWLLFAILLLGGCASTARFPDNPPLVEAKPTMHPQVPESTLVILTISGGGSRASAFAYGVLEALWQTPVYDDANSPSLLDKVNLISAVSGGSIIAAYYGLHGDRLFRDFRSDFIDQDVRSELRQRMLSLENLSRLSSTTFGSGDILDEFFREKLFGEHTLSELFDEQGPMVIINATDLFKGSRFGFTPEFFSLICSDTQQFPVARAVAASSAVPLIFTPVTMTNRAGNCNYPVPQWVHSGLAEKNTNPRRHRLAQIWSRYLNQTEHPYIHLLDGGLSDNLGLRAIMDQVIIHDGLINTLKNHSLNGVRRIVLIEVDAAARLPTEWEKMPSHPPQSVILDAASTTPLSNYNFETKAYLHSHMTPWLEQKRGPEECPDQTDCRLELYFINVDLEDATEQLNGQALSSIPTDFNLPEQGADQLIRAGQRLLREHPEFKRLLGEMYPGN
ncbi:patatin-like phospholipase family protein [Sedimenticola selenatireducens]|uniref:Patatin-like phospholipase family protein n=1 Tax=Sedimenticola selenatireducens TaxID=191960 RepID=A0A557SBT2_9GAMM|nr:patatin-like phospholipase family protein [Sedimenticola selenatireducens]TVO74873.1 patatin-like phospholipase family protein [Sedimenticola selenatireducens]TVT62409.1 MAG: patatin-like phospholipase family protein [Sedimenticola selenatireducens]